MNPNTAAQPSAYKPANTASEILVRAADLPVYCPRGDELLWNAHPRVYIHLESPGDSARCIYCSAVYRLTE